MDDVEVARGGDHVLKHREMVRERIVARAIEAQARGAVGPQVSARARIARGEERDVVAQAD